MPTLLHKYARTEVVFGKTKVLCCTCKLPVRTIGAEAYICSPNPQVAGNGQQVQQLTPQSVLLLDPAHPNYPIDQSPSQPKAPKIPPNFLIMTHTLPPHSLLVAFDQS